MNYVEQRYLERLQSDFRRVASQLQALIARLMKENVSKYPLFVAARGDIELGLKFMDSESMDLYWEFRISHLEEMVKRGLVTKDQLATFKREYPDPLTKACILVVPPNAEQTKFTFIPYPASA